ncbi:TPA: MarR family transcriptional regulator, partial [Klebsiella pneumoniae]|nr:MarR family transcriptional regulator [Klebsiella pneumoniae]HBZ2047625.1 MarR family transcriptional regulator [Klebsiella pneumoniae]
MILTLISIIFFSIMRGRPVTEDELFARRPLGM